MVKANHQVMFRKIKLYLQRWSLQLDEETHKPVSEDVFKEDDEGPGPIKQDDVAEAIGGCQEERCSRRATTSTKEEKIQSLKANYRDRTNRG